MVSLRKPKPCMLCDGWGTVAVRVSSDISNADADDGRTCEACRGTGYLSTPLEHDGALCAGSQRHADPQKLQKS